MLVTSNFAGTTATRFKIGKNGPTVYQGSASPSVSGPVAGDIYIQGGEEPAFYQYDGASWSGLGAGTFDGGSVDGDIAISGNHKLTLGDLQILSSQSFTLADNQTTAATLFFYSGSGNETVWLDYGLTRDSASEMGTIMVINDGTTVQYANNNVGIGLSGIAMKVSMTSGVVSIGYTSTNTGSGGSITINTRRSTI